MEGNEVNRLYAGALLEAAQNQNLVSTVEEEIKALTDLVAQERDFMLYLESPGIATDQKKKFVDSVFSGRFSDLTINFIKVLIDKNRQSLLRNIYTSFNDLADECNNRLKATIVSNIPLDNGLLQKAKKLLGDHYQKEIILDEVIDESILGGIIIRIGDSIIDGSIAKNLRNLRSNLLHSQVRSDFVYED